MRLRFISLLILFALSPTVATIPNDTPSLDATIKAGTLEVLNATNYLQSPTEMGRSDKVIIGDGAISTIWSDVATYEISSYGDHGSVAAIYDSGNIFMLVTHDPSIQWIAIQYDSDNSSDPENFVEEDFEPMSPGDDMWIFGQTTETNVIGDAKAGGQEPPFVIQDDSNDLFWERIAVNDSEGVLEHYAWEIKREFNTFDSQGADVVFGTTPVNMLFASDVLHRPDNSVVYMQLLLSEKAVGGGGVVEIPEIPEQDTSLQPFPYLVKYTAYAILIGTLFFTSANIISTYIMKRNET